MKRLISTATAALLAVGVMSASVSQADAGKRERRIIAGAAIGIAGAILLDNAARKSEKRRRARNYYHEPRRYRRHRRHYEPRRRYYDRPARYYDEPRIVYEEAPRRRYRQARRSLGRNHVSWCYNRYRSYRTSDNTFQPFHGGRRQCYSPYN